MDSSKIEHFKEKLQKELETLETELKTVGRINPDNPMDWQATPPEMDTTQSDRNIVADEIEEFGNNQAILNDLEIRFNEVKDALKRIEDGKYGICKISGKEIEEDRLEANPAAETCKEHMND